jgi:hypothetical protein
MACGSSGTDAPSLNGSGGTAGGGAGGFAGSGGNASGGTGDGSAGSGARGAGATGSTTVLNGTSPSLIALDATHVYFVDVSGTGSVQRVPLAGGAPEVIIETRAHDVAVLDDFVYVKTASSILRVPRAGGSPGTLANGALVGRIAVDAAGVYY